MGKKKIRKEPGSKGSDGSTYIEKQVKRNIKEKKYSEGKEERNGGKERKKGKGKRRKEKGKKGITKR